MTSLHNDYAKLVGYLEKHVKPVVSATEKEPSKKEVVSQSTKSLIEECTISDKKAKKINFKDFEIHSDNPFHPASPFSKGFDVDKFESLMRMKLIDEHKKLQSYERPYISVTELYSCLRKTYYSRLKYPVDLKKQYQFSYLYLINKIGNEVHEVVQQLYDFTDTEKTIVSEKFKVKGRVDAIKENCLVELKTIDADKFKNAYLKEHYYQGSIYSYILNTEYDYSIDTITVVYIIRHLKKIIPFDIEFDSKLAEKFLSYGPVLHSCISRKEVPEPLNATKEQCKYCLYKKYCLDDNSDVERPFENKSKQKSVFLLS